MININLHAGYFTTTNNDPLELLYSIPNPAKRYNDAYYIPARLYYYDTKTNRVPIGHLPTYLNHLNKLNLKYTLHDKRLQRLPNYLEHPFLRPEQSRVQRAIFNNKLNNLPFPVGVGKEATGSGKSYLLSSICLMHVLQGKRVLVLVANDDPYEVAMSRIREDFAKTDPYTNRKGKHVYGARKGRNFYRLGTMRGSKCYHGLVTVAMLQTIKAKMKSKSVIKRRKLREDMVQQLSVYDCIIYDEVDTIANKWLWLLLMDLPAYTRLGLSATPFQVKKKYPERYWHILSLFGGLIEGAGITLFEQWQKGRLQIPKITVYSCGVPFEPPESWYIELNTLSSKLASLRYKITKLRRAKEPVPVDYTANYAKLEVAQKEAVKELARRTANGAYEAMCLCPARLALIIKELRKHKNKPCLISVRLGIHGDFLQQGITKAGFKCNYINSSTTAPAKEKALQAMNSGKAVLISGSGMERGANQPAIRLFIHAAGGDFVEQWQGRPARHDKKHMYFYHVDFTDNYYKNTVASAKQRYKYYEFLKRGENRVELFRL